MSDARAPQQGPVSMPPTRPRRPLWHWLALGGVGLVGLLVVLVVAGVLLWQILLRGNPENTLDDFYRSMEHSDCALYEESTTEEFRELFLSTCDDFQQAMDGFDGVEYEVTDRVNRYGYAIISVTETYTDGSSTQEQDVRFFITRTSGGWYLDGIELLDEDSIEF